jgi:hypothetical protein
MGIVKNHWREWRVRGEQGVYYPDDSFAELCGHPAVGYRADLRAPVAPLAQADPRGWAVLIPHCTVHAGEWKIFAGATSCEAHGFIALERAASGELAWLIHVHDSEEFAQVSLDGEMIQAVSGDDPAQFLWRIPLSDPEDLSVAPRRNRGASRS